MPNIYEDKYFKCVEYYEINEKINIGIKIHERKENYDNYTNTKDKFIMNMNIEIIVYLNLIF